MLSPRRGIIFTAPTLMSGPVTHNTCVCVRLSLCAPEGSSYLSLPHVIHPPAPHVFVSLSGRDVTACFPYQRGLLQAKKKKSEGWKKAELSQWSQHLPVLNWRESRAGGRRVYHMSHLKTVSAHSHGAKQKQSFFSVFFTLLGHIFPKMES